MFESATFESMGAIHTRSRNWMLATFCLNASILAALIAIPLFHPSMLPQWVNPIPMVAPTLVEEPKPIVQRQQPEASSSQTIGIAMQAPRLTPGSSWTDTTVVPPGDGNIVIPGGPASLPGTGCDPLNCRGTQLVVSQTPQPARHISSGVMEGMLMNKVLPAYPPPALALRVAGRVELLATISRSGTIENLRVASGPALLRQAAIDAVRHWRYRPYVLNGQPVEVETTIDVNFALN